MLSGGLVLRLGATNLSQKASSRAMTSRRSRRCRGVDNQQAKERCADAQSPQQPFHEHSERNKQKRKRKPHEQRMNGIAQSRPAT
jgi:hypothetical protein